jgi:hypothetical protein
VKSRRGAGRSVLEAHATGLDLELGYAIWCHYIPGDDSRIRDEVGETRHAVIAISERDGLARTADRLGVVGSSSARLFRLGGSRD